MKQLIMNAHMLYAVANANKGGNAAGVKPQAANANALEVYNGDDFDFPVNARGTGARGSKYMTDEIAATIEGMKPKQVLVIPFMELPDVKDGKKRQRYATKFRIDEWTKAQNEQLAEGDTPLRFTVAIAEPNVAKGQKGGIAVRRDS